jgi:hypothetical protein
MKFPKTIRERFPAAFSNDRRARCDKLADIVPAAPGARLPPVP